MKDEQADQTFDILDSLEKLTSDTSAMSQRRTRFSSLKKKLGKSLEGNVGLKRPRMNGSRQEWHVTQDKTDNCLVFYVKNGDREKAQQALNALMGPEAPELVPYGKDGFGFKIPQNSIENTAQYINNEEVMNLKHPA